MKPYLLISTFILAIAVVSCKSQTQAATDQIVKNSVTNNQGVTLTQIFNNSKGTATFVLNGETIETKQDTMASGIKYSNAHYQYTEHQGEIQITKDGKIIYSYQK